MNVTELLDEVVSAWRANDADRASALFQVDGVYQEAGKEPVVGRDAIRAHFKRFLDGSPWRFHVDEVISEEGRAAVRYRFEIRGSGERWRERGGCAIIHRVGGLIGLWREYQA